MICYIIMNNEDNIIIYLMKFKYNFKIILDFGRSEELIGL